MKQVPIFIMASFMLLITACEDKKDDPDSTSDVAITVIEVITSDINNGSYYYNFTLASEDTSSWHISVQNIPVGNYSMPSVILDSTKVMVAVDSENAFSDISAGPSSSTYSTNTGMVGYGGPNEILNYSFNTHTVTTSTSTYFVYVLATHKVYKIYFEEYSDGVVKFNYAELND